MFVICHLKFVITPKAFGRVVQLGERPDTLRYRGGQRLEMYFVYILQSLKNGRYYVGYTGNLEKRLAEHNSGKTKGNKYLAPFDLVYKETFISETEARKREYYIKSQKSKRFIEKLINKGQ